MGKIGANKLLPKALKGCPKYKKSPNLVTLVTMSTQEELRCTFVFRLKRGLKIC